MDNETLAKIAPSDLEVIGLLYEKNKGLIYKACSPFVSNRYPLEDLMQESYFALIKAIEGYNQGLEKGLDYNFSTYLIKAIKWSLIRYVQQDKNKHDYCYLDSSISTSDDKGQSMVDTIPDKTKDFLYDDLIDDIALLGVSGEVKAILGEDSRTFDILSKYYLQGLTLEEIAIICNVSLSRVGQIKSEALRKIRRRGKRLQALYDDVISSSIKNSGYGFFKEKGMSSVEWAVLRIDDKIQK